MSPTKTADGDPQPKINGTVLPAKEYPMNQNESNKRTMKKITFVVPGRQKYHYRLVGLHVNLDALSPLARALAERVDTTEMADDYSIAYLRCRYTLSEWYKRIIADTTDRYTPWEHKNAEEMLYAVEEGAYKGTGDYVPSITYTWDYLKPGETGEAYFERHAEYIKTEKYRDLMDMELDMNFKGISYSTRHRFEDKVK